MIDTLLARAPAGTLPGDRLTLKGEMPDKAKLDRKMKEMYRRRLPYETRWRAIRDFQLPFVGEFAEDKSNPARRKDLKITQGVAWMSAQIFAAGVMSGLTPPSRQWFKFGFTNEELSDNVEAQKILDERLEITYAALNRSNFYNAIHSVYLELPFGQCPMPIFYDPEDGLRFMPLTIGSYALEVDGFGKVKTVARKYEMTGEQLADCFGVEALPDAIRRQVENGQGLDNKYKVNWLVEPNQEHRPGYINKLNMPYRSIYWLDKSNKDEFLYVGGFEENAVPVARYLANGMEPYAQGPGWFAEGDSKSLQVLKRDYLTAVELAIKPPMQGPAQLMNNGGVNLIPGGLTPVDDAMQQSVKPIFTVQLDLQHAAEEIMRTEEAIKRCYSADLFLMLDNIEAGRMTAKEVVERTQEKLQQLGPVVERLQDEFLTVIIERVYAVLERNNAFPPIPDDLAQQLQDEDVKIEYISPLAQAQKMSGLVSIEQGLAQITGMSQFWPEVLKKIDPIGTAAKYLEMLGAPAVMMRSDEEVAEMIKAEEQMMAEQQQMQSDAAAAQAMAPLATAAKNMTEAANDINPAMAQWMGVSSV